MELRSPAFRSFEILSSEFVADGGNASPPLEWSDPPLGTLEFALVCEDLDFVGKAPEGEPALVHWLIYRIPQEARGLPQGVPRIAALSKRLGALQGVNDFATLGYIGPLPPVGDGLHRYAFTLYALDQEVGLHPGANKKEVFGRMEGHVLDQARLIGLCRRDAAWNVA